MVEIVEGCFEEYLKEDTNSALIHCANCIGKAGAGAALGLKLMFPKAMQQYSQYCRGMPSEKLLGTFYRHGVPTNNHIYNLFGQKDIWNHKDGSPPYNHEAFTSALKAAVEDIEKRGLEKVYANWKIGSLRAGGDWSIIQPLVEELVPNLIWVKYNPTKSIQK